MFRKSRLLLLSSIFIVLSLLGWLWLEFHVLPYVAIRPQRIDINEGQWLQGKVFPEDHGLMAQAFVVQGADGTDIHGYFIPSHQAIGTVVLVHGIGACKEFFLHFASQLVGEQLNVVVFDLRAHGKSGGAFCTYGALEVNDIGSVINQVQKCAPALPIAIYGSSLGGALALQAMAADQRIRCGIVESTYHNLEAVMNHYWSDWTSLSSPSLVHRTLLRSAAIAGFDPTQLDPEVHCRLIDRPVFFAHGSEDEKIPAAFNRRNFEALPSEHKEFFVVEGAHHTDLHHFGGDDYFQRIVHFLRASLCVDSPIDQHGKSQMGGAMFFAPDDRHAFTFTQ